MSKDIVTPLKLAPTWLKTFALQGQLQHQPSAELNSRQNDWRRIKNLKKKATLQKANSPFHSFHCSKAARTTLLQSL
jgi:hypothetical protein